MNEKTKAWLIAVAILIVLIYFSAKDTETTSAGKQAHVGEPVADAPAASDNLTFHGYDCTVDCSGHEAGYQWAEDNDIADEEDCNGNSESFIEGCKAYVEEQQVDDGNYGDY